MNCCGCFLMHHLWIGSLVIWSATGLRLNIVSVILGGNPAYEYGISAPTYDVAFEDANVTYPGMLRDVTRKTIFQLGRSRTCDDEVQSLHDALLSIYGTLRGLSGPTLVQTPGCTEMAIVLGDFAREMNFPLLISSAGGDIFMDPRFPTVIGFGPADHASLRDAAVAMLQAYNWTTISLLCGTLYQFRKPFDITACSSLKVKLRKNRYDVIATDFDPSKVETYAGLMRSVQLTSRVIFLFCDLQFLKPLMLAALARNMTNGDYIFLSPQSSVFPFQLRRPWGKNDSNDETTVKALKSLLIYANKAPDWARVGDTTKRIAHLASSQYATNVSVNFINALNIAVYDGFITLARALNATPSSVSKTDDNSYFTTDWYNEMLYNKSFTLNSGDLYIDPNGFRRVNVDFMRFSNSSFNYEIAWTFDISRKKLFRQSSELADDWQGGRGPPMNRPLCGFNPDGCLKFHDLYLIPEAIGGTALPLILGAVFVGFCFRHLRRHGLLQLAGDSWQLDSACLATPIKTSVFSLHFAFSIIDDVNNINDAQRHSAGTQRTLLGEDPRLLIGSSFADHSWTAIRNYKFDTEWS